jgi:glycosyltransferase involved in cell wall biosynthesis
MSKKKRLSLAIITKNNPANIKTCLSSVAGQTVLPDEILIIDSSTDNKTKHICEAFRSRLKTPIRYVLEPTMGYAAGRNRAVKESKYPWIAFMDDDCIADKRWLSALQETSNKFPTAAAIIGDSKTFYPQNIYALAQQFYEVFWKKNAIDQYAVTDLEILDTKNILYKTSVLQKFRFVTEEHAGKQWTTDDIDMGMQLNTLKIKAYYSHRAIVYHKDRQDFFSYIRKVLVDAISYQFFLKKWKRQPKSASRFSRFSKQQSYDYIFNIYNTPLYKKFAVRFVITLTDQLLRIAPALARYYE